MNEAIRKSKHPTQKRCSYFLKEIISVPLKISAIEILLANKFRVPKSNSSFTEKKEKVTDIHLTKHVYCVYTVYIDIHS